MPTSGSKLPENPPAHDKDTDHRLQLFLDPPAHDKRHGPWIAAVLRPTSSQNRHQHPHCSRFRDLQRKIKVVPRSASADHTAWHPHFQITFPDHISRSASADHKAWHPHCSHSQHQQAGDDAPPPPRSALARLALQWSTCDTRVVLIRWHCDFLWRKQRGTHLSHMRVSCLARLHLRYASGAYLVTVWLPVKETERNTSFTHARFLASKAPPALRKWCLFVDSVTSCEGNTEEHIFHTCTFPGQQASYVMRVVLVWVTVWLPVKETEKNRSTTQMRFLTSKAPTVNWWWSDMTEAGGAFLLTSGVIC